MPLLSIENLVTSLVCFLPELVIKGDIITVLGMNGVRIDQVAKDAIRLDGMEEPIEGNLVFTVSPFSSKVTGKISSVNKTFEISQEPVYFGSLGVHKGVNGYDLGLIEADAIFKGQDVVLKGATNVESLIVQGNLVTPNLLGLNPADILMRDRELVVSGEYI